MANNLKALKVDLKKWNDEEFRSVIVKKNQLLLDLNELDSIEESWQFFFLISNNFINKNHPSTQSVYNRSVTKRNSKS